MAHQWCAEPVPPTPPIDGAAAAVARGNCTFAEKARLVQEHGGEMALIVSADGLVSQGVGRGGRGGWGGRVGRGCGERGGGWCRCTEGRWRLSSVLMAW